jgi:hypothetical protein
MPAFLALSPFTAFKWFETPRRVIAKSGYRQFSEGPIRSHSDSIVETPCRLRVDERR